MLEMEKDLEQNEIRLKEETLVKFRSEECLKQVRDENRELMEVLINYLVI